MAKTAEEILSMPICPVVWVNNKNQNDMAIHCSKECAWFHKDANQCALLVIADYMRKGVLRK